LVKVSVNRYITRRIETTKREVETNTQRLRRIGLTCGVPSRFKILYFFEVGVI
jgi:hypothetical protein